jgi:tetratricopeptide (TPR) repeat protein
LLRMSLELRAMGRAEAAVDSLREFMALYPTSVQREDVMFLLGDILENDLGDIPAAIEQYEKLLIESPGGMHMEEARRRIRQLEMYKQS